jgi:hypothetical protein
MRNARARWVARRTLHRRVGEPVGEMNGVPTYSVEGTQVTLPPGAHHFRRVVACARCQRTLIDHFRPVYRRSDLHAEIAVLCQECAHLPSSPARGDQGPPARA